MALLDYVLEPPSYGWADKDGNLVKPSTGQLFKEYLSRVNIFKTRKNWLAFTCWFWAIALIPFLMVFIFKYFSFWLLGIGFVYSMILMGSHGTVWYHRFGTHNAFKFRNNFWRIFTKNLVLKVIPDEVYIVSHHVHHFKSDQPGDPYNTFVSWLYCFLADANHQMVARNLSEKDYKIATGFLKHTGTAINSYEEYQRWGSISKPLPLWFNWAFNWSFWGVVFYLIGGFPLVCALFGAAHVWAIGVRTFNYEGHGKGKDKRQEGLDFNWEDYSINQYWPGYVAGEWHNNHHLYPHSAQNGFKPDQIDIPWYYIKFMHWLGAIKSYHNNKKDFYEDHYLPYLKQKTEAKKQEAVS
jgi:stearoyl-CoA desaturase (delta-9 desaturase)